MSEGGANDLRPLVLCDCPFLPEFQELFDKRVRCLFVTEFAHTSVDEVTSDDVIATISGAAKAFQATAEDIVAVVSHQHVPFTGSELDRLPNLRVVSNHGVGYGHIDAPYLSRRGVPLGYTPGVASVPTAELGVALILASARNLVPSVRCASDPETTSFNPYWYGQRVAGATLGLVGFGVMGQQLVAFMRGFGVTVLYWSRTRKEPLEEKLGVSWCSGGLEELLGQSDFVVVCVPSSPETRSMLGAKEFKAMKKSGTLVNIARGDVIVQDDLVAALKSGTIRAAALDVTCPEPLPRDHPLLHMDNVIVTSHIGSACKVDRRRMAEMCLENLIAGLQGEELPYAVHQATKPGTKRRADQDAL